MRVSNATLLAVMGLATAAVLVATAGGLFADSPPAGDRAGVALRPAASVPPPAPVPAQPAAATQPPVAPEPRPLQATAPAPPVQEEWRVPAQADVKAARPPAGAGELPPLPAVFTPSEQQAAWAARDQLANAGRAARPAPSAALTRAHEGAAPDKQAAGR